MTKHPLSKDQRTLTGAKKVDLAVVSYTDDKGGDHTQLAVVGDNTVFLLDGKMTGFSSTATPHGRAADWLSKQILSALKGKS